MHWGIAWQSAPEPEPLLSKAYANLRKETEEEAKQRAKRQSPPSLIKGELQMKKAGRHKESGSKEGAVVEIPWTRMCGVRSCSQEKIRESWGP